MDREKNKDLIYGLYDQIVAPKEKEKEESGEESQERHYEADTNTLFSGAQIEEQLRGLPNNVRHEIFREPKEFNMIALGQIKFLVVKEENMKLGDTLVISETEGFTQTGRKLIKVVTHIMRSSNSDLIKSGYCIVNW